MRFSSIGLLLLTAAPAAHPQLAADTDAATNASPGDEVDSMVTEFKARGRQRVSSQRIEVYESHFAIGERQFESLEALLAYIAEMPLGQFPQVTFKECIPLYQAREIMAATSKLEEERRKEAAEKSGDPFLRVVQQGVANRIAG